MKKHSMIFSFFLFAGIANAQEGIQGKIGVEGVEISATDDSVYVQMDMDFLLCMFLLTGPFRCSLRCRPMRRYVVCRE